MRGFPKHFETKEDYYNTLNLFPSETKKALKQLYNNRFHWVKGKELKDPQKGIVDAKHIVIEEKSEDNKDAVKYYQYSMEEDPNARYIRLGFTKEEINKLI